jgi:hypothetical protein
MNPHQQYFGHTVLIGILEDTIKLGPRFFGRPDLRVVLDTNRVQVVKICFGYNLVLSVQHAPLMIPTPID